MKTKNDFVTNSSSTNFLIGDNNKDSEDLEIVIKFNVTKKSDKISTYNELKKHYMFEDWFNKDGILKEEFTGEYELQKLRKCHEILSNGGVIYIIEASSESDDPIEVAIYEHGIMKSDFNRPNDVEIIMGG